jgi:hypothetical protein
MMDGSFENRVLERRTIMAVCQHREKEWVISIHGWLFSCIMRRFVRYLSEFVENAT